MASIPPVAHFIWFGSTLHWVHVLAFRSAVERGGFERVILHHADELRDTKHWAEVKALSRFETRPLDPIDLLGRCPRGRELIEIFRELKEPAGKANMVRAALLFLEGGTFLDSDTVTVKSFLPLLASGGVFCGVERINRPYELRISRSPRVLVPMFIRRVIRSALREAPGGWRVFRWVERFYPTAVNNAVLASEPGHPLIADLLDRMASLPAERRRVRYALGTHLLQQAVAGYRGRDLRIMEPQVFYPLGPEISIHWFRTTRNARVADVLSPDTLLVHWYASVRTSSIIPSIDPAYVRARSGTQLFSALAAPFVES